MPALDLHCTSTQSTPADFIWTSNLLPRCGMRAPGIQSVCTSESCVFAAQMGWVESTNTNTQPLPKGGKKFTSLHKWLFGIPPKMSNPHHHLSAKCGILPNTLQLSTMPRLAGQIRRWLFPPTGLATQPGLWSFWLITTCTLSKMTRTIVTEENWHTDGASSPFAAHNETIRHRIRSTAWAVSGQGRVDVAGREEAL